MNDIDFVITWANENDKERIEYLKNSSINEDVRFLRYRDWEFLKYWFRSIEKNANFYRFIYFVTKDKIPSWLNTDNPQLKIIKHKDIIEPKYMPTFNDNAIEFCISNIDGLSEKFVYFNDDVFINKKINEDEFFKYDLPVYSFGIRETQKNDSVISSILNNTVKTINKYFRKNEVLFKNYKKLLSYKNGLKTQIKTFLMLVKHRNRFPGFKNVHMTMPMLKSVLLEIRKEAYKEVETTCSNRFRSKTDISIIIVLIWECLIGKFIPTSARDVKYYSISDDNVDEIVDEIKNKKHSQICLNDGENISDFIYIKNRINTVFEEMYPKKSTFEK